MFKARLLLVVLLGTSLARSGYADELAEKGRAIFKKYQHAVVTVQLVVKSKLSMAGSGGQSSESRQEATGTVIDPSGLLVLSLSATDPGQMIQSMLGGDEEMKLKFESELSDIKLLLEDGTEVPAEVVLRDKDLDLAFVRPKAKLATPLPAVELTQPGKAEVLDQVSSINRLGNAAGRAYGTAVERISAVVQKPRLFYVPETTMTTTALGAPAFTLDGKLLGVFVVRSLKTKSSSEGGMMGMLAMQNGAGVTGIILPVADIQNAAKQVPPQEKK